LDNIKGVILTNSISYPKFRAWDHNDNPLVGGKLYSYVSGTTTLTNTYSDVDLLIPNTNPVILDSAGEAIVYLDGSAKLVLKDSDDVLLWTADDVTAETLWTFSPAQAGVFYSSVLYGGSQAVIEDALTAIGSSEATLYLAPSDWILDDDLTIPANVQLKPERGALIHKGVFNLTINNFDAGLYQIFSCTGSGKVVFGVGSVKEVNAAWFGLTGDSGTTNNYAPIQLALGSLQTGMELVIPKASGYYGVTNTAALTCSTSDIKVRIDGDLYSTSDQVDLFTFSGSRVKCYGLGSLRGPGTFDGENYWASLIRFTGGDCKATGLIFDYPPTAGVTFWDCVGGEAHGNLFRGGPDSDAGLNTHFGVLVHSGSKVNITDNRFTRYPGDATGRIITAIHLTMFDSLVDPDGETSSATRDCVVTGNIGDNMIQHLVYAYGNRNIVMNNVAKYCGAFSFQIVGQWNTVSNNKAFYGAGGITLGDASDCIVDNNTIDQCDNDTSYGILVQPFLTNNELSRNRISGNIINKSYYAGIAFNPIFGAYTAASVDDNVVDGNILTDIGKIDLTSAAEHGIYFGEDSVTKARNQITHNSINGVYGKGIDVLAFTGGKISHNIINDYDLQTLGTWGKAIDLFASTGNIIESNEIIANDSNLWGIYEGVGSSANKYRDNDITVSGYPIFLAAASSMVWVSDTKSISTSAAITFSLGDARTYLVTPGAALNFNPDSAGALGTFPAGYEIVLVNLSGTYAITFDSAGLNQAVTAGQRGIFVFDGTAWKKVYVG
jgi:parallel beta-helix repeat protein